MIPQETIQEIQNRIDIIDIVGSFVKLKKEVVIILEYAHSTMKKRLPLPYHHQKRYINVLDVVNPVIRLASSWSMNVIPMWKHSNG